MNSNQKAVIFTLSVISLSLNGCQSDIKSGQSLRSRFYKMSAPEQVMTVGMMRYIKKNIRIFPVKLGGKGEIPAMCIFPMNGAPRCNLYHTDEGFSSDTGCIPRENVDDILGQMDNKMMCQYLSSGKIGMSMGSDREMILRAMMMGRGGIGHNFASICERWAGYAFTFLCMRSVSKALESLPEFVNGIALGRGPDGSVLNRVATAAEMISAGYKEVSPGKWVMEKVLNKLVPDTVKDATVYTLYEAMPEALKESIKLAQQSGLYTTGQAIGATIKDSAHRACDFVGRACEIAGFMPQPIYYFENGVIKKAAEKVVTGLTAAKDAFETTTGTSIFSQTAKGMVKDMVVEGLGGAALSIGLDLAGGAIGYFFDAGHLTPKKSIIGGVVTKWASGEGTTVDAVVDKAGLAVVAAEGFGKATGNYVLRKGVYWIVRAIPLPIP